MSDSVELYTTDDGVTSLLVRTDAETVWLTRQQLAVLFGRDVKTIGKHIANALREELEGEAEATVAKFATVQREGQRSVTRNVEHYSLDLIISIGYRVKSSEGVRFRKWATDVLREYLIEGAATNQRRLDQLNKIVQVLGRSDDRLVAGVADVLSSFLPAMTMLREFDEGHIPTEPRGIPDWTLTLDEARRVIRNAGRQFPSDTLFGRERGDGVAAVIGAIYQGFGDHELYPTVEEKAANLLYFVVKDHPLADGNKRSAAALFLTFLDRNNALMKDDGGTRVANNALAAITLLVAMSDPTEKELMIALIVRMIVPESE
ncbi:death-on-curing family protein [Brevibacterium sp. CCUG 69071]|nr:death-on-curing family protein [Brevibacterium sp. CCUG 69071]